jgi:putative PEP-CTERM system histidine kinase
MLSYTLLISLVAASLAGLVAALALYRDPHPLVHKVFAAGMAVLAVEAVLIGLSWGASGPQEMIAWQKWRYLVSAFLPVVWLTFGLSYARADHRENLRRWKWTLGLILIIPLALTVLFRDALFSGLPVWIPDEGWVIPLGWAGYTFNLFLLIASILILLDLEKTLRGSHGVMRWQIKFTVLGLIALFAARIFTVSQNILYRSEDLDLALVNSGASIVAGVLMLRSLFRTKFFSAELYVSQNVLYNSLTLLIIGIYFIVVSLLAKLSTFWFRGRALPLQAFFLLVALVGLTILIFSDRLRRKTKLFISRNFQRPLYDYRKEWIRFTQETTAVRNVQDLCQAVTRMVSDILHFLSVTIWLVDEAGERLVLGGSTAITRQEADFLRSFEKAQKELIEAMAMEVDPVDFGSISSSWSINIPELDRDFLKAARIRYVVTLRAGETLIGLLTLDQRVAEDLLTLEDFDLLKTVADQTSAGLNQLRLAEKLQKTREMEAFQTMSTFFIHDLKNVASRLSLTMQNLPVHFNNPEFRQDALQSIGQSLEKINGLCSRLSSLREKLEVHLKEADLNEMVKKTLAEFEGALQARLIQDLTPLPRIPLDLEQISKVLTNLVLNASEALTPGTAGGEIRAATRCLNNWVEFSVSDNGQGMSREMMECSLFLPFKTTKKHGMGIGLFQSKMIVEAHGGRIEVESEEGKGTTFRVLLPTHKK